MLVGNLKAWKHIYIQIVHVNYSSHAHPVVW